MTVFVLPSALPIKVDGIQCQEMSRVPGFASGHIRLSYHLEGRVHGKDSSSFRLSILVRDLIPLAVRGLLSPSTSLRKCEEITYASR